MIGYARVSTEEQNLDRQVDELEAAGCERVFSDQGVSGSVMSRPALDEALNYLRAGDVLVVQALDRLGRNTLGLLRLIDWLRDHDIGLRILTLGVDTTRPAGRLVLTMIGALAEMEREIIRERTRSGLDASRARGKVGGRRPSLSPAQVALARRLADEGHFQKHIAEVLGVSDRTIRRVLAAPVDTYCEVGGERER